MQRRGWCLTTDATVEQLPNSSLFTSPLVLSQFSSVRRFSMPRSSKRRAIRRSLPVL